MDLDDIFEPLDDIEDIAEEIFEPDELLEDFSAEPLTILFALVAAGAGAFTLLMVFLLLVLFLLRVSLVALVAGLVVFGVFLTALAIGVFLYVRSGVPHETQKKINHARSHARESDDEETRLTEEEAIDQLSEQYAHGEITDDELEDGLEEIMEHDDPETVVREYERE